MVKRTWKQEVKRNWPLYVLVSPAIILAIIFCYIPMGGLVMAFQNYKPWLGITGSEFVGMANFKQIFAFQESYQAIINTYVYRQSLINGQYSFGTAVGLFKSVIGLILTVISYRIAYKVAGYRIF